MGREARMRTLLEAEFAPVELVIRDDSGMHAGHAGAAPGGETHYTITIVSDKFTGKSRLEQQRMVMSALKAEFDSGLHALSLKLSAA